MADPSTPVQLAVKSKQPLFTVEQRLECGNFSIPEILTLKKRSRTGFYQDVEAGLVKIEKIGRKSIVRGPVAKRYIAGLPITDDQGPSSTAPKCEGVPSNGNALENSSSVASDSFEKHPKVPGTQDQKASSPRVPAALKAEGNAS